MGITESADFPNSTGGLQSDGLNYDNFLVKIDLQDRAMVYSSVVGGSADDGLRGILVDEQGYVYASGGTGSADFPLVEPVYTEYLGGQAPEQRWSWYGPGDALVAKYDPEGRLIFSTLLPGSGAEFGTGLVIDSRQNLLVTGETRSADMLPIAAFQDASGGGWDGFLARFALLGLFGEPTPTPEPTETPTTAPTETPAPTDVPRTEIVPEASTADDFVTQPPEAAPTESALEPPGGGSSAGILIAVVAGALVAVAAAIIILRRRDVR